MFESVKIACVISKHFIKMGLKKSRSYIFYHIFFDHQFDYPT